MSKTTIEKLQAEINALEARRAAVAEQLQLLESRQASERQAAHEKLALALADGDQKRARAAEQELEAALDDRAAARLRLEAEGLALRIDQLRERLAAAEAERMEAYRSWLEGKAGSVAQNILRLTEQLREALVELRELSLLSGQEGGGYWVTNSHVHDVTAPVHEVFAEARASRSGNLLRALPHEQERARERLQAEARAAGLLAAS